MAKPRIVIISPYLANANNGNWQTAWRWSRFLAKKYEVSLSLEWDGKACDAMIALHARRSASAIAAFAAAYPTRPLVVALTGTDLYRDILSDESAQRSLHLATTLLVLQAGFGASKRTLQQCSGKAVRLTQPKALYSSFHFWVAAECHA